MKGKVRRMAMVSREKNKNNNTNLIIDRYCILYNNHSSLSSNHIHTHTHLTLNTIESNNNEYNSHTLNYYSVCAIIDVRIYLLKIIIKKKNAEKDLSFLFRQFRFLLFDFIV